MSRSIGLNVLVVLTVAVAVLRWGFTPTDGFTREFYPSGDFTSAPSRLERTSEIGLAFVERNTSLPRRSFGVQWRGFWYVAQYGNMAFEVVSEDEVLLQIDSRTVLQRSARQQPRTMRRQVMLARGSHEIVVRYRQHGTDMGLAVRAGPAGGDLVNLPAASFFSERADRHALVISTAARWLTRIVVVVWVAILSLATTRRLVDSFTRWRRLKVPTAAVFVRRVRLAAGAALLGPIIVFLVAPLTVYTANRDEFVVPFNDILWSWSLGAIVVSWAILIAVAAIVALLSERLTRVYAAVLLALGLLLWAQGTLLVADYGLLYGETLHFDRHASRGPFELALWAAVLAGAIRFAGPLSRAAPSLSLTFVGLQIVAVAVALSSAAQARDREPTSWRTPPSELYVLSSQRNVIHIVLDGYLSELFGEEVAENRTFFDNTFSGFTYFADHLGAFPTTRASMPAMLTGEVYRNDEPFQQFIDKTLNRRSIVTVLAEHGYAVRSVSFHPREHPKLPGGAPAVRYTIPTPYGSYKDYVRFAALQLFDLSAFRCVPHVLKPWLYHDDEWLWQRMFVHDGLSSQRSRTARASNHAAFLDEMAERLSVGAKTPVYQFVHVAIPHLPVVLDAECSPIWKAGMSRGEYAGQSRCAIAVVGRLLNRLRTLGVYDASDILLTSDHGWRALRQGHPLAGVLTPAGDLQPVALTAMPLLAVKPHNASGPLRVSMAPTHITDIPATIADMAGLPSQLFPGEPALRIAPGTMRQRGFAYHSWQNADWRREYMDSLYVFSVAGPIHRPESWHFERRIDNPTRQKAANSIAGPERPE